MVAIKIPQESHSSTVIKRRDQCCLSLLLIGIKRRENKLLRRKRRRRRRNVWIKTENTKTRKKKELKPNLQKFSGESNQLKSLTSYQTSKHNFTDLKNLKTDKISTFPAANCEFEIRGVHSQPLKKG